MPRRDAKRRVKPMRELRNAELELGDNRVPSLLFRPVLRAVEVEKGAREKDVG